MAEAPSSAGSILPLTDFGTVSFSQATATISGVTGSISDGAWQHDSVTMETTAGVVKATPSVLGSTGDSFTVTWQHQ